MTPYKLYLLFIVLCGVASFKFGLVWPLWFVVTVIILLIRQFEKHHQSKEKDNSGQVLPTSAVDAESHPTYDVATVDAESHPAYDVVMKSPPLYIIYPDHGIAPYPAASMYYCYCGSDSASSPCKHLNQGDSFLPSYSEAANVFTYGTDKNIHLYDCSSIIP
ncbi:unnamed protein product [Meganyctiphanes norvegica]|uniref:SWIM-type domain-containing protein n=1 Tax=Meganyctiphanes norvegica TaxID=48144 RepID=A0AAV2QHH1_MEGNR